MSPQLSGPSSNSLADLEEDPIEFPCQSLRDELQEANNIRYKITQSRRSLEEKYDATRRLLQTCHQDKNICLERVQVGQDRLSLMIKQSERDVNRPVPSCKPATKATCPPSRCRPCPTCPAIPTTRPCSEPTCPPCQICPTTTTPIPVTSPSCPSCPTITTPAPRSCPKITLCPQCTTSRSTPRLMTFIIYL